LFLRCNLIRQRGTARAPQTEILLIDEYQPFCSLLYGRKPTRKLGYTDKQSSKAVATSTIRLRYVEAMISLQQLLQHATTLYEESKNNTSILCLSLIVASIRRRFATLPVRHLNVSHLWTFRYEDVSLPPRMFVTCLTACNMQ